MRTTHAGPALPTQVDRGVARDRDHLGHQRGELPVERPSPSPYLEMGRLKDIFRPVARGKHHAANCHQRFAAAL